MGKIKTPPLNQEEFIAAGVNYWANFFKTPANGRVASKELEGVEALRCELAHYAATSDVIISDFKIERFKDHLRVQMEEKLKTSLQLGGRSWTVVIDWQPEFEIATACRYAELPGSVFPTRMMMFFDPMEGTVTVSPIGEEGRTQIYPVVA